MTDGFSGAESASDLSQSKAERVRHRYSYGFCVLTRLCKKSDVLCVLKTHSSWVYITPLISCNIIFDSSSANPQEVALE
jgi:hypothetical protein